MMPGNAWLPTWLGVAATAVFVVVLAMLTGLLVAWFLGQALGWIIGRLSTIADAATAEPIDIAGHHLATGAGAAAPGATTECATPAPVTHASAHSLSIRATLTVMSLGMAYMFLHVPGHAARHDPHGRQHVTMTLP
jgi:hypothetical protein